MLYFKEYINSTEKDWVIFLHGAGGSSTIWYRQLREFKKHFNLLLLDLRGHGKSQSLEDEKMELIPRQKYSFREVTEDVLHVMDEVGISKAHFVGMSLGTIIIRNIAELSPERVKSMVMGGAVTRFNIKSRFLIKLGNMINRFIPLMWLYRLFAYIIMPRKRHSESRHMFIREAKKVCHKEFMRWYRMTSELNPLLKYFNEKDTQLPTLYIMGGEDYMFLSPVKEMVKEHHNSNLKILEGSGHVCNVDNAEKFNKAALEFIYSNL